MKSVLISIQPKWCELIASGKKTIEVRKTRPKLETPFKCYIYCTKDGLYKYRVRFDKNRLAIPEPWNGKVIGEFVCDRIEKFVVGSLGCDDVQKEACISYSEICDYFYGKNYDNTVRVGNAWHISDLKIYDKPRELGEFGTYKIEWVNTEGWYKAVFSPLKRPPQSWYYVDELETDGVLRLGPPKQKFYVNKYGVEAEE